MKGAAKLNTAKLRADTAKAKADRIEKRPTAAYVLMAAVRTLLPTIEALLDPEQSGATWNDIAAALTNQGLQTRDGGPITGRRLSSLVDSLRKQDIARKLRAARRRHRSDVAPDDKPSKTFVLAAELSNGPASDLLPSLEMEHEARTTAHAKHANLFKERK